MRQIRRHIREKQRRFAELDFFSRLDRNQSPEEALGFIRRLTFFVMVFQDVLRLNEGRVTDPALRRIARHHRAEDRGHDQWFLADLLLLEGTLPDARELFGANAVTREVAYQIVSEVLAADDDRVRVALLLVLESTGHVFFQRVIGNAERLGLAQGLLYFARRHLDIELGHELFEEEMNAVIDAAILDDEEERRVLAAVDRSFAAMARMIEALGEPVEIAAPSSRRSVAPPSGIVVREGPPRRRASGGEG